MKLALLILFAATLCLRAQTNQVTVEKRADGWWAIWTNTPALFKISTSSNMVDWTLWMSKHSGTPLTSMELHIVESNNVRFLKFEPVYPPAVSKNLTDILRTYTNAINSRMKK